MAQDDSSAGRARVDALLGQVGQGVDPRLAALLRALESAGGDLDDPMVRHLSRHGAVLRERALPDGSFPGDIERALSALPPGMFQPSMRMLSRDMREVRVPAVVLAQVARQAIEPPASIPPRPSDTERQPSYVPAPSVPPSSTATAGALLRTAVIGRPIGLPRPRAQRDIATGEAGPGSDRTIMELKDKAGRPLDGRGVIIGIIDYGFDLTHPALRWAGREARDVPPSAATAFDRTRLIALWDQTARPRKLEDLPAGGAGPPKPGRMALPGLAGEPRHFLYGRVWSSLEIDGGGQGVTPSILGTYDDRMRREVWNWIRLQLWSACGRTGEYKPHDKSTDGTVRLIEERIRAANAAMTREVESLFDPGWIAELLAKHPAPRGQATRASPDDLAVRISRRIGEGRLDALRASWAEGYSPVAGNDTRDFVGHGTHVASVAAGSAVPVRRRYRDAGATFRGIAPGAEIIAVQLDLVEEDWHEGGREGTGQDRGIFGGGSEPGVNPGERAAGSGSGEGLHCAWGGRMRGEDVRKFCREARDEVLDRLALRSFEYGDSYALRDALYFVVARAWQEWEARKDPTDPIKGLVINVSLGAHGGGHDGRSRFEQAADEVIKGWEKACESIPNPARRPMISIVVSAGNAHDADRPNHQGFVLKPGESAEFSWHLPDRRYDMIPDDYVHERTPRVEDTPNELEIRFALKAGAPNAVCSDNNRPSIHVEPLRRPTPDPTAPTTAFGRTGVGAMRAGSSSMDFWLGGDASASMGFARSAPERSVADASLPERAARERTLPRERNTLSSDSPTTIGDETIVMVFDQMPWRGIDIRNTTEMNSFRHLLQSLIRGAAPARPAVDDRCEALTEPSKPPDNAPAKEQADYEKKLATYRANYSSNVSKIRPGLASIVVNGVKLRHLDPVAVLDFLVTLTNPGDMDMEVHAWIERDLEGDRSYLLPRPPLASSPGTTRLPPHTLGALASGQSTVVVGTYLVHPRGMIDAAPFTGRGPLPWTGTLFAAARAPGNHPPHLCALGVGVVGADGGVPGGFGRLTGSSQAVAHVTGAIALLMQAAASPMTAQQIRECLQKAARDWPGQLRVAQGRTVSGPRRSDWWDPALGAGPLDIERAVNLAKLHGTAPAPRARQGRRP